MAEVEGIWKARKGEPANCRQAFEYYLSLPLDKRSFTAVANSTKHTNSTISNWSRKWDWQARARAYDAHIAEIEKKSVQKAIDKLDNKLERGVSIIEEVITATVDVFRDTRDAIRERKEVGDQAIAFPDLATKDLLRSFADTGRTLVTWEAAKLQGGEKDVADEDSLDYDGMSEDELEAIARAGEVIEKRRTG